MAIKNFYTGVYVGDNLGIGIDTPASKLHVNGNVLLSNNNELRWLSSTGAQESILELNASDLLSLTAPGRIRIVPDGNAAIDLFSGHNTKYIMSSVHSWEDNNSNVALRITAGGNVGIGTTSPGSKLDVNGNVTLNYTGGSSASNQISMVGSRASFGYDGSISSAFMRSSDTSKPLVFGSGTSELMRIVSSTGNVGIGTTSPSAKLQISTTMTSSPTSNIFLDVDGTNTNGGGGSIIFATSASAGSVTSYNAKITGIRAAGGSGGDSQLGFWTTLVSDSVNPQERMTITKEGNIGIGTTSPSEKLHVDGDARVTGAYYDSGNAPGTVNQVLASTATGTSWIDPGTITAEAATLVVIACKNTSGATITKGTPVYQTGTVGATDVIEIAAADALISSGKQPAIGLLQTTLNNNGFGKVVITGEFLNFTTDPIDGVTPTTGDKVFLKSGGGLTLTKPTGAGNGIQNLGLIGKVSGGNAGSITVSSIMRTNDVPNLPEGRIWVGDGNTIVSDTVFLDEPNGRMGIGTTTPSEKLEVVGKILVTANSTALAAGYFATLSSDYATDTLKLTSKVGDVFRATNFGRDVSILTGTTTTTEKMRILANGNVGIGTTSPGAKLEIESSSEPGIRLRETGGTNYYDLKTDGSIAWFGDRANNEKNLVVTAGGGAEIRTNGDLVAVKVENQAPAGSLYVKSTTGNVGIGTTSPGQKLHVVGEGKIQGNLMVGSSGDVAGAAGQLHIKGPNAQVIVLEDTDNANLVVRLSAEETVGFKIEDTTNSNVLLFGDEDGNVGIGTTSPSTKLHVEATTSPQARIGYDANNYVQVSVNGVGDTTIAPTGNGLIAADLTLSAGSAYVKLDAQTNNVGIGTTSPSAALEVAGGITLSDNSALTWATSNTRIFGQAGYMQFQVGATDKMRITSAGDVGIGTTAPRAKLDVAGGIKVADDTDTAGANKVGTLRYRYVPGSPKNYSYVDMCMQTGTSSYAWVNIVQNVW